MVGTLWWLSSVLHRHGLRRTARLLSLINFFLHHADLPPECSVPRDVLLFHRGLGIVVNPQVTVGRRARIVHGVTIGVVASKGGLAPGRVVIEDDVRIGANAVIIAGAGEVLVLGSGCQVGAMAYVRKSVPAGAVVRAPLAEVLPARAPGALLT
jgi:serine acetyltransferase